MQKRLYFLIVLFIFHCDSLRSQSEFPIPVYPLHVIFDTDFGPDYDDVGAITLLHAFADSGSIRILATMASSRHKNVAAAINVFNTYFNRPEIPIGVVGEPGLALSDKQHWTDSVIQWYPHQIKNNQEAFDALELYRKILSTQLDHSVTIITVGFMTNLANLLSSAPDQFSGLNGMDLVRKKVIRLVSMGGRFPTGREFNLDQDPGSSIKVMNDWPTPILFSGFEIGQKIKTGLPLIENNKIEHSPVKDVFALCIPFSKEDSAGRMSWDETAVLVAVKGWKPFYNMNFGTCVMLKDGTNQWMSEGNHMAHLVEKLPPQEMSAIINQLIMHQPVFINK